jgi:hypothetical protein
MKPTTLSALIVTASLAVTGAAHATTSLTPFASNVLTFAPMPDGTGVMAEYTDGSFSRLVWTGSSWGTQPRIPGGNAVGPLGVTVATNPQTNATYVFEIEKSGLWANRLIDGNNEWSGWCHFDSRTNLATAPTAAPVGMGFSAFAVDSGYSLVEWRIDEQGGWCSSVTTSTIGTADIGNPVAVSWGGTRVDVFAHTMYGSDLEHFWSADGHTYGNEEYFTIGGTLQTLPIDYIEEGSLSAVSLGYGRLDVIYRDDGAGGHRTKLIQHLSWDNGWSLGNLGVGEESVVAASALPYLFSSLFVADMARNDVRLCTGITTLGDSTAPFPAGPNYIVQLAGHVLSADGYHRIVALGDNQTLYYSNTAFD